MVILISEKAPSEACNARLTWFLVYFLRAYKDWLLLQLLDFGVFTADISVMVNVGRGQVLLHNP